ncbi:lysophospholipid acyltransferase family protein [Thiosulfatimonas sediminis]|nr:lysophospholipid acyltransferase family protein [Thiosulfatimonas sediminis]
MAISQKFPSVRKIGESIVAWFVIGFLNISAWLPFTWLQGLGRFFGGLMARFNSHSRFLVRCNLRAVYPQLSDAELTVLSKAVLQHNAQSITELGAMWLGSRQTLQGLIHNVHGEQYLQSAFAQGKGVLLLAPHLGNWELAGNYLAMNYPATFMYRPPNLRALAPLMRRSRERFGAQLAPTDLRGVRQVIKALKSAQVSGILPDQDAGENGVQVPFMGVPARTMTLASKLLQKTDAHCLFIMALRNQKGGFELHILPADRDALADKDPVRAATALNHGVAQCVQQAPEQYLWAYRRFRGAPGIYQK